MREESKHRLSSVMKGRIAWNKGLPNPHAASNGRKGALTQSLKVKGRKKTLREDGSWYWTYPNKYGPEGP